MLCTADDMKVLSITPAQPGWFVEYLYEGAKIVLPVACWAFCESYADEDESGKTVRLTFQHVRPVGISGDGRAMCILDEDDPDSINMGTFIGIIGPGEDTTCGIIEAANKTKAAS